MFKKTLLAIAVTGFVGAANAATIAQTAIIYSAEGIVGETIFDLDTDIAATSTASADVGTVVVAVGIDNGYVVGDKIVFTFPNDVFDISTNAVLDVDSVADASVATFTGPNYSGGNSVSFTIATVGNGATAVAKTALATEFVLSGINLTKTNILAGGDVKVEYKVVSSVNDTDYETKTATIAKVEAEITATVSTPLDAVVDVASKRKVFEDTDGKGANGGVGNEQDFNDSLVITPVVAGSTLGVTPSKVNYTVYGDFSFMDTDDDGTADYTATVTGGNAITLEAFAEDFQSFSFLDTTAAPSAVTVEFEATDGTTVITTGDFTADVAVTYTPNTGTAKSKTFSALNAGSWTLNGSSTDVALMPFGSAFAQSITVTNTSALAGEVTVELTAGGVTYTKELTTIAAAKNVTQIGKEIATFAAASGIQGDAAIKVVVNAPAGSVTVKALYFAKTDQDRVLTK